MKIVIIVVEIVVIIITVIIIVICRYSIDSLRTSKRYNIYI